MSSNSLQILVVGCGGLGGVTAARLVEAGHNVTAVTGNDEITTAIRKNGLTASFDEGIHHVMEVSLTDASLYLGTVDGALEGFADATLTQKQLCACAEAMVTVFGGHFAQWRDDNVAAGRRWEDFSDFAAPDPAGCDGLPSEAAEAVGEFLRERYSRWREVSYRLHVLVGALAALRNTYPRATLHDCDDGSDANPVRLGQTVLGSN